MLPIQKKASRGAPLKAPGGLTHVLYIRIDESMHEVLEEILKERRAKFPGISMSTADVVRGMVWEQITQEGKLPWRAKETPKRSSRKSQKCSKQ